MDQLVQRVRTQTIYIISDSTADLGSRYVDSQLQQFDDSGISRQLFRFVNTEVRVRQVMELAQTADAYVVYTLVDPRLCELVAKLAEEYGIKARGLMTSKIVKDLAEYLGQEPRGKPGPRINAAYFEREQREWDALKFAIEHDDGQHMEDLLDAQVVLVGVSRVRKSQVSKELALKGLMVANVPLAVEVPIYAMLQDGALDPGRVFALTMMPARLLQIRRKRLESAANGLPLSYAEMDYIRQDLARVDRLARKKGWTIIDGTDRGIEETAAEIAQKINERFS